MKSGRIINALTAVILSLCLAGCGGTMQASAPELEMGQEDGTVPEAPAEGEAEEASGEDTEEESLISEIEAILSLCDDDIKADVLDSIFIAENYQKLIGRKEEIKRRLLGDGKKS